MTSRSGILFVCALVCACAPGIEPARCAVDADCGAEAFCQGGACHPGTGPTCPKLEPHFRSIREHLFNVGCGVRDLNCHSTGSAAEFGQLDLQTDPWGHLVGQPATNAAGDSSVSPLLVRSDGDARESQNFLLRKLKLDVSSGASGAGMPVEAPGSTCADAQATIAAWIAAGAPND